MGSRAVSEMIATILAVSDGHVDHLVVFFFINLLISLLIV